MTTYNTSDFRKGLKIQIDGVPYLMVEMNFRKPGKGNALYECKLKNLVRGTVRRSHLPRRPDARSGRRRRVRRPVPVPPAGHVRVHEQRRPTSSTSSRKEQVGDAWKFLKDGMECIADGLQQQPAHRDAAEPRRAARSNTPSRPPAATRPPTCRSRCKLETGAEIGAPAFVNTGDYLRIDTRTGEYIERANAPEERADAAGQDRVRTPGELRSSRPDMPGALAG